MDCKIAMKMKSVNFSKKKKLMWKNCYENKFSSKNNRIDGLCGLKIELAWLSAFQPKIFDN